MASDRPLARPCGPGSGGCRRRQSARWRETETTFTSGRSIISGRPRPTGTEPMMKRPFGSTGLAISALGLGCNNFGARLDLEKTKAVVDAAIDAGVNFIDTADT